MDHPRPCFLNPQFLVNFSLVTTDFRAFFRLLTSIPEWTGAQSNDTRLQESSDPSYGLLVGQAARLGSACD